MTNLPGYFRLLLLYFFSLVFISCGSSSTDVSQSLDELTMPEGFNISIYAADVPNARSMTMSPSGVLFVGTRQAGNVYAVTDENNDFKADRVITIAEGLAMPNGVAFRDGALYVAEVSRILRYDNIERNLENPPEPVVVNDSYPTEGHHGWKYIDFGPGGKLYVPVGAPCNICESENEIFASITRINPDGSGREIVAHGVRNTVGFTWHPETNDLWFTDNNRDWMGDDQPPGELNHLTQLGQHFGYPYLHGNDIWDPEFGEKGRSMDRDFKTPAQLLGPHVAPLGVRFYTGSMFPEEYHNQIFIAEHGSWNRSKKIGYRITLVRLENGNPVSYEPFIEGWLREDESVWGRPVALLQLSDGSMLISDDQSGTIYRLTYNSN
ncbi:PQQ-dependent sugar dehydrogenase [Aliifodinibius sp. S!AR15-10]|uniref:PQQ-dependent sugar dehydrogenase n=1 Tax=Aliifodinibius sp. S!AR15-10 TaxID=2950437 RepID=UPI002870A477|nr:PQQ-dependent sugar dehydrogenase [Aliifodinibius sp. S!AR15-10]